MQASVVPNTAIATVTAITKRRGNPIPPSIVSPRLRTMSPIGAADAPAASNPVSSFPLSSWIVYAVLIQAPVAKYSKR